jgi:hypothetical protein
LFGCFQDGKEIARLPGFSGIRMKSLGSMCRHEKNVDDDLCNESSRWRRADFLAISAKVF